VARASTAVSPRRGQPLAAIAPPGSQFPVCEMFLWWRRREID